MALWSTRLRAGCLHQDRRVSQAADARPANSYIKGLSVERYLQQIGLSELSTGGLRLRMAALLLFAKDVWRWHPRCQIRLMRVLGSTLGAGDAYNVKEDATEEGNIFKLLVRGWDILRTTFLVQRTQFAPGARFELKFVYPEQACREALINAIAHRDYSISNGIEVFIYDDRLEVRNPGALLSTLKLADLEGAHEWRNPLIARVLREHRYISSTRAQAGWGWWWATWRAVSSPRSIEEQAPGVLSRVFRCEDSLYRSPTSALSAPL